MGRWIRKSTKLVGCREVLRDASSKASSFESGHCGGVIRKGHPPILWPFLIPRNSRAVTLEHLRRERHWLRMWSRSRHLGTEFDGSTHAVELLKIFHYKEQFCLWRAKKCQDRLILPAKCWDFCLTNSIHVWFREKWSPKLPACVPPSWSPRHSKETTREARLLNLPHAMHTSGDPSL